MRNFFIFYFSNFPFSDIHSQHGRHDHRGLVTATSVDQKDNENRFRQQTDLHHGRRPAVDHQTEEMRFPGRNTAGDRSHIHVQRLHGPVSDGRQQKTMRMRTVVLQENR